MLIDGRWITAASGRSFEVCNPADGSRLARLPEGAAGEVDLAVRAARRALENGPWSRTSAPERARHVWRIAEKLDDAADELAEIITLENGKPLADAVLEVQRAAEMFRYMAGWATKLDGSTLNNALHGTFHTYTRREPVGVVGAIVPWNFPLGLTSWKVAPALAAGCTIVLKPAEETPLAALRLGELIAETGLPDGVLKCCHGVRRDGRRGTRRS